VRACGELLVSEIDSSSRPLHEALSDREYHLRLRIGAGKTVSEIAGEIHLSVKTVSTHRARILKKMGMKNNAELARYCAQWKLIEPW